MFFRIGEVSEITGVKPYVLRYWESEFRLLRPSKNKSGQRVYRRREVETVLEIKDLLHRRKFTIAGAKKWLELINGLTHDRESAPRSGSSARGRGRCAR